MGALRNQGIHFVFCIQLNHLKKNTPNWDDISTLNGLSMRNKIALLILQKDFDGFNASLTFQSGYS